MKRYLIFFLVFSFFFFSCSNVKGQTCGPALLQIVKIRASDTDPNISWEANRHHSFYNPDCISKNRLVVHFVGSYDNPSSTLKFPSLAANNGFHVVSLKYPNGTAAKTACANSSDVNCYVKFRREILEGQDYSTEVVVDSVDGVYNRLIRVLQYLEVINPPEGWGNYFTGNTIDWNKVVVSGHSQGGGHAAVIGLDCKVYRVLMFASPNDYSDFYSAPAEWTTLQKATPDSVYFGFNNTVDNVVDFSEQFEAWGNLGMPAFGDTIDVGFVEPPYSNSHQLFTQYDTTGIGGNHSVMILDSKTPVDNLGEPLFHPVWEYMLGISSETVGVAEVSTSAFQIYPNPVESFIVIEGVSANKSIELYDATGKKLVVSADYYSNTSVRLSLSDLQSGVYFLKIDSEVLKIVKQ